MEWVRNCKNCLIKQPNLAAADKDSDFWRFPMDYECAGDYPCFPDWAKICSHFILERHPERHADKANDFYLCTRFADCIGKYDEPCPCGRPHEYDIEICGCEQGCPDFPGAECRSVVIVWQDE